MKDLLKMDLQYFAEDPEPETDGAEDGQESPKDENPEEDKTVNVEEMKRRIDKEKKSHEKEMDDLKELFKTQLREEVKKAQMGEDELQKYKEQETIRKLEEKDKEIERLRAQETRRQLADEAINTLSEKKMPVNDKVLNFVVKDNAEDTRQAIDDLSDILKAQKEEFAQSEAPIGSGGIGTSEGEESTAELLDRARITDI